MDDLPLRTGLVDPMSARDAVQGLFLGRLWQLHDDAAPPGAVVAGVAVLGDDSTLVLAATDPRARRLTRAQFGESIGPGPECLRTRLPSRRAPDPGTELAQLERTFGVTDRLAVPIGSDEPPAILTCWSTNGAIDETAVIRAATDVTTLVHRARELTRHLKRAGQIEALLEGTDDDAVDVAVGILMERERLSAAQASARLEDLAADAGQAVDELARSLVDRRRPVADD